MLEDETIVKCGCHIDDDMVDLRRMVPGWKHLEAKSRFDLGLLGVSKNRLGLKTLTRLMLQRTLEKPKRLAVSDWSQSPLSDEQIAYGARDAWAGAAVLEELARLDPDLFGIQALFELLQSQPSLEELDHSQSRRKEAKKRLSKFHKSYHKANAGMPPRVKQKISKLKAILKENQLDFSIGESLAFIPDEARSYALELE